MKYIFLFIVITLSACTISPQESIKDIDTSPTLEMMENVEEITITSKGDHVYIIENNRIVGRLAYVAVGYSVIHSGALIAIFFISFSIGFIISISN